MFYLNFFIYAYSLFREILQSKIMTLMVLAQNLLQLHLWKMYKLYDVQSSILVVNYMLLARIQKHCVFVAIQNSAISGM